jgi:haloalkane dehalogenase
LNPEDPKAIDNVKSPKTLAHPKRPFPAVFGREDPIMKRADIVFQEEVPGAKNQPHQIWMAGPFIQQEKGAELASALLDFYQKYRTH